MSAFDVDPEVNVEDGGGEPEMEFVELAEGQDVPVEEPAQPAAPGPLGVQLTPEQLQELLGKAGGGQTALQGLEQLAQRMQPQVVQQPAAPLPTLNAEELEQELFKPGKTAETLKRFLAEQLAPVQAQQNQVLIAQNRELLRLRPDTGKYFTKYQAEIDQLVQGAPAHVRTQPDVYEQAYRAVVAKHQQEIIDEEVNARAEKLVQAALEKAGIQPQGTMKRAPALQMEGAPGGAVKPQVKKTVYITQEHVRDMVERGMDPKDPDQKKFYWEKYVKNQGRK